MFSNTAGVDEAGRGPLAGPVVAAAVVLNPAQPIAGLGDSKSLRETRRQALATEIYAKAWTGIGIAEPEEIDRRNILQATLIAMARAIRALPVLPHQILIDGNKIPEGLPAPAEAVVKGDAKIGEIAAASILAKTLRDQLMLEAAERFPLYRFDKHKGYPSPVHKTALTKYGPCPIHRRSYAPVRIALESGQDLKR